MSASYHDIEAAFLGTGLVARGGFAATEEDAVPGLTVVMIGNVGPEMWKHFSNSGIVGSDPLDTWTKSVVGKRASALQAQALYPNDRPYKPFQQWAKRADSVFTSPLGILIHQDYGLWHAYRAALIFPDLVTGMPVVDGTNPCDICVEKPCLTTCPVSAFDGETYDVPRCVEHLESGSGQNCHQQGCLARLACPIAPEQCSPVAQRAFHAAAFFRSQS